MKLTLAFAPGACAIAPYILLKEAGADCLKILLYYTPFDPKPVNEFKHAWVERIGDECRAQIAFALSRWILQRPRFEY